VTRHGCFDRKAFAPSLLVQDGWDNIAGFSPSGSGLSIRARVPRMVAIPFRMAEECKYEPPKNMRPDPGCEGCRWRSH